MPIGGTSGQILAKPDELDFNTMWIDPANSGIRRQLGDTVLGGTVIYFNSTGIHGLIAANTDQSFAITWWDAPNRVTNPAAFDNDGQSQSDWRVPTLNELSLIYAMRNELVNSTAIIIGVQQKNPLPIPRCKVLKPGLRQILVKEKLQESGQYVPSDSYKSGNKIHFGISFNNPLMPNL